MKLTEIVLLVSVFCCVTFCLAQAQPGADECASTTNCCGPVVVVGDDEGRNISIRGVCEPVTPSGDCTCFAEEQCPNANSECDEIPIRFYCCCYRFVNPPENCYESLRPKVLPKTKSVGKSRLDFLKSRRKIKKQPPSHRKKIGRPSKISKQED